MQLSMLGAGYVGLVSAACFAEFGAQVSCIDIDRARIAALQAGQVPIYEPGLGALLAKNLSAGRLRFVVQGDAAAAAAIAKSDLVFIAVGTPARRGDGQADLSFIYQAARELAAQLRGYTVVVDKSTVPVGTARQVRAIIREVNPAADFDMAANPEFLREGAAIADFMRPDRVVLGIDSARAEAVLRELYRPLNLIEAPILATDIESAELIKYATNAFLATKISFINEMAALSEALGADVHAVAKGMGLDGRIGRKFLHPGPGYGGSCLPKDTQALAGMGRQHDVPSRIVEAVIAVNEAQKARMLAKIRQALGAGPKDHGADHNADQHAGGEVANEKKGEAWTPATVAGGGEADQETGGEVANEKKGEAWTPAALAGGGAADQDTGGEVAGEKKGETWTPAALAGSGAADQETGGEVGNEKKGEAWTPAALAGAGAADQDTGGEVASERRGEAWTPATLAGTGAADQETGGEVANEKKGEAWTPAVVAGAGARGTARPLLDTAMQAKESGAAGNEKGNEKGKTIAVLGLTFKPETDDMRAAPALSILPPLLENGAQLRAHDPQGIAAAKALLPAALIYFDDMYEAARDADAIVLLTEWNAYRGLDLARLRELMRDNIFIDLRNVYEPAAMRAAGFRYVCIGR